MNRNNEGRPFGYETFSSWQVLFQGFLILGLVSMLACKSPDHKPAQRLSAQQRAKAVVETQVADYLGKADYSGVPVLDANVNWHDFNNWPDQFSYQGKAYPISLCLHHLDMFKDIKSRDQIEKGWGVLASYYDVKDEPFPVLSPVGCWYESGAIKEIGISSPGNNVYQLQYYPQGEIFMISFTEAESGIYHLECYDRKGRLRGEEVYPGKATSKAIHCYWNGKAINEELFHQKIWSLYKQEAKRGSY